MKTTDIIIRTDRLNFSFGQQQVIHNLDLEVPESAIYGFLGPNGAGKSTTIKLLLGLLQPPEDRVTLFGKSYRNHRVAILQQVGNLIEAPSLYRHLTARENLRYLDRIYRMGTSRIEEVLDIVGLNAARDKKVKHFSLGMKQRLGIGIAMFHKPKVLFLDEPFNGLDPAGVAEMRKLLRRLQAEGTTIFLSSHILSEIEKICSHVGIITHGRLQYEGEMKNLVQHSTRKVAVTTPDPETVRQLVAAAPFELLTSHGLSVDFKVRDGGEFNRLMYFLTNHHIPIHNIETRASSLEDVFFNLTQA